MKSCSNKACPENNPQPEDRFNKNNRTKDGLTYQCKTCLRVAGRIQREKRVTKDCSFKPCSNKTDSEYCEGHRAQLRKGLPLAPIISGKRNMRTVVDGKKRCSVCKEWLELSKFSIHQGRSGDRVSRCKRCHACVNHHIAPEMFNLLLEQQGKKCAICPVEHSDTNPLCIDHDHRCCPGKASCGKCVRSLLCGHCNRMIGHARESVEILQSAINLLSKDSRYATFSALGKSDRR